MITVWGIAIRGEEKGNWVKCYVFEDIQEELAIALAEDRTDLWPLKVTKNDKVIFYFSK